MALEKRLETGTDQCAPQMTALAFRPAFIGEVKAVGVLAGPHEW